MVAWIKGLPPLVKWGLPLLVVCVSAGAWIGGVDRALVAIQGDVDDLESDFNDCRECAADAAVVTAERLTALEVKIDLLLEHFGIRPIR